MNLLTAARVSLAILILFLSGHASATPLAQADTPQSPAGQMVANNSWMVERVDDQHSFVGGHHHFKYDSANYPHVVYGGDHLYHAWSDSGGYHTEVVDPAFGVGQYASLAIDNQDKLHIAYYDSANGDLKYATNQFGYWYIKTVVSAGNVGAGTDIAVDSDQDPYFVYNDSTCNHLMFASLYQGDMVDPPENISGSRNPDTSFSMVMRNPLEVHVVFHVYGGTEPDLTGSLYYTSSKQTTPWTPSLVDWGDSQTGLQNDIALDTSGNPQVVFGLQYGDLLVTRYFVTTNYGVSWTQPYGQFIEAGLPDAIALRLTNTNIPHVAIQYSGTLYHYCWNGVQWNSETVDDPVDATGYYPALALASSGDVIGFAYMDNPAGTVVHLNYRWLSGGVYYPTYGPMHLDRSQEVGACSTALSGPGGNPWVIYSAGADNTLYIRRFVNGAWLARQEVTTGLSGTVRCEHAADIDGSTVGLLYATTDNNLYYIQLDCSGAACTIPSSTLVVTGMNTFFFDVDLDGGVPYMVYTKTINAGSKNLVYRDGSGTEHVGLQSTMWSFSGRPLSILRNDNGAILVVYQLLALYDELYYVTYGHGWTTPQLLNSGEVYRGVSLSLDPSGQPAVAFVVTHPAPDKLSLLQRSADTGWPVPPAVTDSWSGATSYHKPSLQVDTLGRYHLGSVAEAGSTRNLEYRLRTGSSTLTQTLYTDPTLDTWSSLALSPGGLTRMSFQAGGDLLVAWQQARVYLPTVIR